METVAPHLVRPLPFLIPLGGPIGPLTGGLSSLGVRAGDVLRRLAGSPSQALPRPRRVSAAEAMRLVPHLASRGLRGGILFWDGQVVDDARLVIAVARTAAGRGAAILPRVAALSAERDRVVAQDQVGGGLLTVRARHVVNATGVWADRLSPGVRLRPSKGSHLIVRGDALGWPRAALALPVPGATARWVGATPTLDGAVIVGVTDEEHRGGRDEPLSPSDPERDFLLGVLNPALEPPLPAAAVVGGYSGLRPLVGGPGARATADLSRRELIHEDRETGLLSVVGGKLTTYRRMAEDVVDRLTGRRCRTAALPLVGAADPGRLARLRLRHNPRLVDRYGAEAPEVEALGARDPALLEPVAPGLSPLGVELLFGLLHEGAMGMEDVLDRRVRLGLIPADRRRAEEPARHLLSGEVIA
jgi:glycerol-3-phosphate dehydrogenase